MTVRSFKRRKNQKKGGIKGQKIKEEEKRHMHMDYKDFVVYDASFHYLSLVQFQEVNSIQLSACYSSNKTVCITQKNKKRKQASIKKKLEYCTKFTPHSALLLPIFSSQTQSYIFFIFLDLYLFRSESYS